MLKSTLTMLSVLGERMKARDPRRYSCLEDPHGQRSLAGYSP